MLSLQICPMISVPPMNAIIGFSDIIAEHPDDEEIVKNAISKIQASGEILPKIINDVLDLSKIESGKAEIVEMVTDLEANGRKSENDARIQHPKGND